MNRERKLLEVKNLHKAYELVHAQQQTYLKKEKKL